MAQLIAAVLLAASAAAAEPARVRVLTMNAAAIPVVHGYVAPRLDALAAGIKEGGFDVAGLQEVWFDSDSRRLERGAGLPHVARSRRGFPLSAGLTILSRWPIVESEERAFSVLRPSWFRISNGEPAANKGVLRARVATPWGELDVYDSHLLSNYGRPDYEALRLTELFELAEFVRERSAGRAFVVLADLNAGRGKADFDLFMDLLGARDACREREKELCGDVKRKGARIDFILMPSGGPSPAARAVFDGVVPGLQAIPYSDHSGYAADLLPAHFRLLGPAPDARRRAAALEALDARLTRMIERLNAKTSSLSWVPVYGSLAHARYDRQIVRLSAIRERAATAAIRR
ncbi:MAG: endonuclease/exonuclease/phosphatase family protein [Elusimicrobia bacterium]|nr:endonuclease/exonuclease/phosphatase family protein [Elusimicrobiota bacterium]